MDISHPNAPAEPRREIPIVIDLGACGREPLTRSIGAQATYDLARSTNTPIGCQADVDEGVTGSCHASGRFPDAAACAHICLISDAASSCQLWHGFWRPRSVRRRLDSHTGLASIPLLVAVGVRCDKSAVPVPPRSEQDAPSRLQGMPNMCLPRRRRAPEL